LQNHPANVHCHSVLHQLKNLPVAASTVAVQTKQMYQGETGKQINTSLNGFSQK
jgi:hypothetical protein